MPRGPRSTKTCLCSRVCAPVRAGATAQGARSAQAMGRRGTAACEGDDRCVQGRCEQPVCQAGATLRRRPQTVEECVVGRRLEVVDCDEGMTCEEGACRVRVCVDDEVGCFDATTRASAMRTDRF